MKKGGTIKEGKLNCRVFPGQFSDEYGVQGVLHDNRNFDLFAPRKYVKPNKGQGEPKHGEPVKGIIQVILGPEKNDLILVTLPRPTFENGQTITVKKSQLTPAGKR